MHHHVLLVVLLAVVVAAFFVAPPAVAGSIAVVAAGVAIALSWAIKRALRAPVRTGNESLAGGTAKVIEWDQHAGLVHYRGELWRASSPSTFRPKERVYVVKAEGTLLHVRPADAEATASTGA